MRRNGHLLLAVLCAVAAVSCATFGDWGWAAWFTVLGYMNLLVAKAAR